MTPEQIARARQQLAARGLIDISATDAQVEQVAQRLAGSHGGTTQRPIQFAPATLNADARTVDITLATEAPVPMWDWQRMDVVDEILLMSGWDSNVRRGRVSMLDTHQRHSVKNVLGSIYDFRIEGGNLAARSEFSTVQAADDAFTLVREGHLDGISAGYLVRGAHYIEPGQSMEIGGRTFTASDTRVLKVATNWSTHEGSLCPIGADGNCGTRAVTLPQQTTTPKTENVTMNREQIIEALMGRGYDDNVAGVLADGILAKDEGERAAALEAVPAATVATPEPTPEPEQRTTPTPAPTVDIEAQMRAERERCEAIDAAAADFARLGVQNVDNLARQARSAGHSLVEFRAAAAEALQSQRQPIRITRDQHENTREAIESAVLIRSGARVEFTEREETLGRELAGMTLRELARHSLEQSGVSTRGMDPMELAGRAFSHSTGDFSSALQNASNKSLLAAYQVAPNAWNRWCSRRSLSDFKSAPLIRMSEAGIMTLVPDGADIPNHTMTDKQETIQLGTYAQIFGITRQTVINDDLDVFGRIPAAHGRAWARTINQLAVKVLLTNAALADTVALFHASHSNLDTSTATVTDQATAEAVIRSLTLKIQKQMDLDGKSQLNLTPAIVLTSPELARYYVQAVGEVGRADNNRAVDIAQLGLSVISEAEISNTNLTGYGANITYALCNPMDAPVVEVGFLNGSDAPRLESKEGFSIDGLQLKVAGDCAAAASGYRGGAKHVN